MAFRLEPDEVAELAGEYGWTETAFEPSQGNLMFLEQSVGGERFMLHVWCSTGTVGSYLNHPRQGKTQLYRRNVSMHGLAEIFNNPRVHTNGGYQRRPDVNAARGHERKREYGCSDVSCPGCGKQYKSIVHTAQHFETGRCTGCLGVDNARHTAYTALREREAAAGNIGRWTAGPQLLTYDGDLDLSDGYTSGGFNYHCPYCRKQFKQLSSLLQHQQARAACATAGVPAFAGRQALTYRA